MPNRTWHVALDMCAGGVLGLQGGFKVLALVRNFCGDCRALP
jgi:hypothetical protein